MADLPLAELSARRAELARRWAIALLLLRPSDDIGAVPLEEIVSRGPELLEAALAAVGSDAALARLAGAGAPTPAASLPAICGTADAAAVAEAGESMRAVLGTALAEELVLAPAGELTATTDRLAHVCAVTVATALRAHGAAVGDVPPGEGDGGQRPAQAPGTQAPAAQAPGTQAPVASAAPGPVAPSRLRETARAALVDEHAPVRAPGADEDAAREQLPGRVLRDGVADLRDGAGTGEIEIRDERGEGPGAWIGAIGRQLERHASDGRPFAVLLVELVELERVRELESAAEAERLDRELERTLSAELARARDAAAALVRPPLTEQLAAGAPGALTLTRERPGRYWMVSAASDRGAARHLSERISAALAEWRSSGGRPLSVVIGAAACPEDGSEAAGLAAYADVDLYAARSAARGHAAAGGEDG